MIGIGIGVGLSRPSSSGGYYITIPGASGGLFDETTGEIGAIATASTNLPDIGNGLAWSMVAGSDADISIHATTGVVSSARAIYDGDSATFSLRVENGEVGVDEGAIAIEAPFEAVGTVAVDTSWILTDALIDLDYENDRAYAYGVGYPSIAAARTAGVVVQSGGIDRVALTGLTAPYTFAAKGTTHSASVVGQTARYLAALDAASTANMIYFAQVDSGGAKLSHAVITATFDQAPPSLNTATGAGTSSAVRYATRIATNNVAVSFNGAAVSSDTGVTLPTVTQLVVGNRHDAARPWLGTVKRVAVVNATTSDANLPNIFA